MLTARPQDSPSAVFRTGTTLRDTPVRIAAAYVTFGVLWIWLSDTALAWLKLPGDLGYWAATGKGTAFVLLSAAVVFLTARREVRALLHAACLLDAVAKATTDAVVVKDAAGRYLFCNAAAAQIVGRPVAEIVGRDQVAVFGAAGGRMTERDQRIMQSGVGEEYEEPLTVGGRERTYHVVKAPYLDARGSVAAMVGVYRDVTERNRAEAEVRHARLMLRLVLDTVPQGVFWKDAQSRHLGCNAVVARALGFDSPEQLVGRTDAEIPSLGPGQAARYMRDDQEVIRTGTARLRGREQLTRADGSTVWLETHKLPLRDDTGRVVGVIGTWEDVTERRQTEEALRESEGQFRATFEQAAVGMAHVGLDGRFVRANERFAAITGLTREELLAATFQGITHPDDLAADLSLVGRLLAGEVPFYSLEKRYLQKGGGVVWVNLTVSLRRDERGEPIYFISVVEDITARKWTEAALRDSERRFRATAAAAPVAFWETDPDMLCTFLSCGWQELTGQDPADGLGLGWLAMTHSDDAAAAEAAFRAANDRRQAVDIDYRVRRADGRYAWVVDRARPRFGPAGEFLGMVGAVIDIDARKQAVAALRASEGRLRLFVEHAPAALAMFDRDMRYLVASRRWISDYRLQDTDLTGRSHYDLFPEIPDEWRAVHARGLAGEVVRADRDSFRRADGSVQWLRWEVRPWHDAAWAVAGIVMFADDITAGVEAEAALRESEERVRATFEQAAVGIAHIDPAGRFVWVNERYAALTGYTRAELVAGLTLDAVTHPDDRPRDAEGIARLTAGETQAYAPEKRFVRKDGSLCWVQVTVSAPRLPDGRVVHLIGVAQDITDRKRAEAALRESEERFRNLVEFLPDAVFLNVGGRVAFCNPACVRLFGAADATDLIGKTPFDLHPPEWHDILRRRVTSQEATGEPVPGIEEEVLRLDGRRVPVYVAALPVMDRGVRALLVVLHDLTERKRAEAQLHQQELMIREAGELAHVGGWGFDPATGRGDWTEETARIHTLPPAAEASVAEGLSFYAGEDRARIEAAVAAAAADGTPYDLELRLTAADGLEKWVRTICRPIVDGGRVVRVRGSIQDITDRKRTEEEIRALNADLERRVRDRTAELVAANAELESFSYSVSHDLRSPIRHITGFAAIVLEACGPQLPPENHGHLEQVVKAARRMGQLVDDLLKFSRLGRRSLCRQAVDTGRLVDDCLREVLPNPAGRRIETRVGDLPACFGDPGLLRQVWINLLSNAVKYTGRRDPAVIQVGATATPDGVAYFVQDNGAGFDMRYAHKLFGVFQRLHRAEEFEGTGIGLALVQRIVHQHGGRAWAEAEPGKGATFWFTLGRPG
ncbi:PAS domain S-box protein [Limnoglobus roseus]|uniref:histidine kinase n=1 Tax=Limnoglobus roseus TaxID=2598579 RepID=A0A5C1ASH3_9BACT|nr:PAS domain S-box protein [Limnoglobus roseus]QEL20592.1 PAS domain S-box protein [Limnoglobus roseus]